MNTLNAEAMPLKINPSDIRQVVTKCRNLRLNESRTALETVMPPADIAVGQWIPVAQRTADDGSTFYVYRKGPTMAVLNGFMPVATVEIGSGEWTLLHNKSRLVVMTDGRRREFNVTPDSIVESGRRAPLPRLTAAGATDVTATVESTELSRGYDSGDPIVLNDARRLWAKAADMYDDLDTAAREAGRWCMPVVMAVRVTDADGRRVMMTPPALIAPAGYDPHDGSIEFTIGNYRTTARITAQAATWTVKLDPGIAPDDNGRYTYEVLATPMLQRVDPTGGWGIERRHRADQTWCWHVFPRRRGVAAVWPGAPGSQLASLCRLLDRFDSTANVIATFTVGSGANTQTLTVTPPRDSNPANDNAEISRALELAPLNAQLGWVRAPHSFSAAMAAEGDTATLYGDITVKPWEGQPASRYAVATDAASGPWRAVTRVTMDDGATVVTLEEGSEGAPVKFNALIAYPSPRAVSLYIAVEAGGRVKTATYDLTPTADGMNAVWLAPGCDATGPDGTATVLAIPATTGSPRRYRRALLAAPATDTSTPATSLMPDCGGVRDMLPARHPQGNWDYGRSRFTVFTDTGIHSLTVDKDCRSMAMSPLDSRTVAARGLTVDGGDRLWAVAADMLVSIAGNKVTTVATARNVKALGYDAARREVWMAHDGGDVTVADTAAGCCYTVTLGIEAPSAVTLGRNTAICDGRIFYLPGSVRKTPSVNVAWEVRIRDKCRQSICRRLEARIAGKTYGAVLDVSRLYFNSKAPGAQLTLTLQGRPGSAITRPFIARGGDWCVSVTGSVGPDFLIDKIIID